MSRIFPKHIILSKSVWIALLFVFLGILGSTVYRHYEHFDVKHYVVGSDMEGYYQYLPFFFLRDWEEFNHLPWAKPYEEGKSLSAFTCGVAIMQAPFFLMAHGTSLFLQLENRNGYGSVYYVFIFLASLFYVLLGLIFLYKALKRYFSAKTAFWTAALIFYATNLFYYTIISPGMSHAYSFCLMAVFIYMVPVFYEKPGYKNAAFLAFPLALATLIRPTNLIAAIYFLLYGIEGWASLKLRFKFFVKRWNLLLVMVFVGFVVMIPQMLYWHFVTGEFVFYSYQDEGFLYILSPKIGTVLFGARNGWFVYTPVMLVAMPGLFYLVYRRKLNALAILLLMVCIIYIDGSWWAPTFSAAAGYRALIEYIPFMAIPLAFVYEKSYSSGLPKIKWIITGLFILFVIYNVLFAYKYSSWLWWDTEWQWSYLLRLFKF